MDQQKNNYLIKDWMLPQPREKSYKSNDDQTLSDCSKLNVLIGPNNSGKSLLLRSLFSDEAMEFTPATVEYQNIIDRIQNANMELSEIANNSN